MNGRPSELECSLPGVSLHCLTLVSIDPEPTLWFCYLPFALIIPNHSFHSLPCYFHDWEELALQSCPHQDPWPPFFVFLAWLRYAPLGGLFIPSYCGKRWHRQSIIILKWLDRNLRFSMVGTKSCATWTPSAYQKLMSAIKPSTALGPLSPLQLLPWGPFKKRHFKHMWPEQLNN